MRICPCAVEDAADAPPSGGAIAPVVGHLIRHDRPAPGLAVRVLGLSWCALDQTDLLEPLGTGRRSAAAVVGPVLIEAALAYSRGCLRGLGVVPDDPATARWARLAGFAVHPTTRWPDGWTGRPYRSSTASVGDPGPSGPWSSRWIGRSGRAGARTTRSSRPAPVFWCVT